MKFSFIQKIHSKIKDQCVRDELKLRSAGNGLWLCFLLPAALCCNVRQFDRYSELYKTISIVSVGQLICAISNVLPNNNDQIPLGSIGLILSSTIVSLLLVFCTDHGIVSVIGIAVLSCLSYSKVFQTLISRCPSSFTYGEGVLAAQGVVLFLTSFGSNLVILWGRSPPKRCDETATFILQTGFFAVFVLLLLASQFPEVMKNRAIFLMVLCSIVGTFVLGLPYIVIKKNVLLWLLNLLNNLKSMKLIALWLICSFAAIFFLFKQSKEAKSASSVTRKSFHLIILVVLLPGYIIHPCLAYLASGVALALLIVIEMARKLKLTAHVILQSCFEAFKDEKDEGELALTPLYLMIGCVAPMWFYPFSYSKYVPLPVVAGLLTVGVGDSMASVGGTLLGNHRWPKSAKTIEGTFCCFLSQLFTLLLLNYFGFVRLKCFVGISCVLVVVSILEALTDQIDNIILPFISYILFSVIG